MQYSISRLSRFENCLRDFVFGNDIRINQNLHWDPPGHDDKLYLAARLLIKRLHPERFILYILHYFWHPFFYVIALLAKQIIH